MHVPRRGDVLEGYFKSAPLTRGQRRCAARDDCPRFTQRDLVHFIEEFNGQLQSANGPVSTVNHFPVQCSHFLVQEVLRAAQNDVFHANFAGVLSFRWAEGKVRILRSAIRR